MDTFQPKREDTNVITNVDTNVDTFHRIRERCDWFFMYYSEFLVTKNWGVFDSSSWTSFFFFHCAFEHDFEQETSQMWIQMWIQKWIQMWIQLWIFYIWWVVVTECFLQALISEQHGTNNHSFIRGPAMLSLLLLCLTELNQSNDVLQK